MIFTRGNIFGAASCGVPILSAGICFWKRYFSITYQIGGHFLIEHRASHWRVLVYFCAVFVLGFMLGVIGNVYSAGSKLERMLSIIGVVVNAALLGTLVFYFSLSFLTGAVSYH